MGSTMTELTAHTKYKDYSIIIGDSVLSNIERMNRILLRDRFAVIVSSNVMRLYEKLIKTSFGRYDNFDIFIMQDGEENKNYRYAEEFFNKLLDKCYSRKSSIITIGGGVVGDFAGFIASVFMRGIPLLHIPTTLLAMVDSSIGGKVAVNISTGKNIIGTFHQPEIVITDIGFLKTLPDNELKNGLTEVLKHAIIGESSLLNVLNENNLNSIRELSSIERIVYYSVLFKKKVIEEDEEEEGIRAVLNFGHTAGHAIESMLERKGISHGEAVAIGIKIEAEISRRLGWLSDADMQQITDLIAAYRLIYNDYRLNADDIIDHMRYDKKNIAGKINFVLLKGLGNPVYNQEVEYNLLKDVLVNIKYTV